ncbi:hypothetical protein D7B24_002845 [Verticillium nonalfalfae]|uniref:PHD-type domain-containing protein n=1 Tax=Verticillium nonalfalfae TaxID=1051616 RepID=A0A3M9Y0C0_9PEZI|nr:uncharacterized protein D7B24_002845 [Verticillium nonalfalfae]RNJ52828.1 hypothetical protein D7B24_002845 [Verticillium nonalfalfae]
MATSTRATRSRFSSPLQLPTANTNAGPGPSPLETSRSSVNDATTKTFLQKWLEPSVQSKPSYEDHGLVRYGVTEGMVPLGEMPKSIPVAKKKEGQPVRRIILKKSTAHLQAAQATARASATAAASTPTPPATKTEFDRRSSYSTVAEGVETTAVDSDGAGADAAASVVLGTKPESGSGSAPDSVTPASPSPQPLAQEASAPAAAEKPMRRALPTNESDDEHDQKSTGTKTTTTLRNPLSRRSLNRVSTGRRASTSHQPAAVSTSTPVPASASASTPTPTPTAASAPATDLTTAAPEQTVPARERIERVIEQAIHEALDHCRYPTAWALRTLYDEKSSDAHFLTLVESIFSQTADSSVVDEFAKLIEAKKREGNKENRARDHFGPPSPNPNGMSGQKRKRAPYAKLITLDLTKARRPSSPEPTPAPAVPPPVVEAPAPVPATPIGVTPSKRKHKSRKQHTASPFMAKPSTIGDGGALVTPSRRRARRDSAGSDSSALSELSGSPSLPSPTPAAIRDRNVEGAAAPATSAKIIFNELRPSRQRNAKTTKMIVDAPDPSALSSSGSPAPADPAISDIPSSPQFADAVPARRPVGRPAKGSKTTRAAKANAKASAQGKSNNEVSAVDEANTARRRTARLQSNFADVDAPEESSIRGETQNSASASANATSAIDPPFWDELEAPVSTPIAGLPTRKTRQSVAGNASVPGTQANGRTTRSNKRGFDELEASSPTARSFPPDVASNVNSSRAGTPVSTRAVKKQRTGTGLRVKSSPKKKTIGTAAGVPRQSGEGHPFSSSGAHFNSDDNDDYCSACGGVGELVCCEHCSRSFHFECVDLLVDEPLPDEWFCQRCIGTRFPTRSSDKRPGHFGALLAVLDKTNPGAFELPQHIQTYFENVRAGPQGDYEEENAVVPKVPKKRGGYEEAPDFHKVRDADGSPVLCHNCQQATASDRSIIPCSICGLHWHLDCLDPPLAIPPVLRTWVCPAHNDDLLAKLPGSLAPAHKYRKIRDATVITPLYSRGMKNNGFIEVINDESDNDSGWNDVTSFGRTYRLPEKGIVLDFVSQKPVAPAAPDDEQLEAAPESRPMIGQVSITEHQAALNLAQLRESNSDGISQLTTALLDNADPAVLSLIARGDATNLASGNLGQRDQQSLQAMLAECKAMEARIHAALAGQSPTARDGDALSAKTESAEVDLPTPATTGPDHLESANSKSDQGEAGIMDVD